VRPFGGFRGQNPVTFGASCGLTLRAWWSFGRVWQPGATVNNGSGEDRLEQFDALFPDAGPTCSLVQATDATRPRYYDTTWKGQIVPHNPAGRTAFMECYDANVIAMADAELCSYTIMGVNNFVTGPRSPCWWWDGLGYEDPLILVGGNIQAYRWTSGGGASAHTICAASKLSGQVAWCVIRRGVAGGGVQETWIGSEYQGEVTHSLVGAFTCTALLTGNADSSSDTSMAELMLFEGVPQLDGVSDPYRRFNSLSPIYSAMRARWGV
jgi:hypothetical protein